MRNWDWASWLFLAFFIFACVLPMLRMSSRRRSRMDQEGFVPHEKGQSPHEILEGRYAKGEITKEQFDAIKRDLEDSKQKKAG